MHAGARYDSGDRIRTTAVVGSTHRRTTALAGAAARATDSPRARPREMAPFIIYIFSTACMEWHDGHTTRSKDARMVIEPLIQVC